MPSSHDAGRRPTLRVVDCHHHLWDLSANRYPWLTDSPVRPIYGSYAGIRRDYLLDEFRSEAPEIETTMSVHVEAGHDPDDPVRETRWLSMLAEQDGSGGFPHAIVAYADFRSPAVERVLDRHAAFDRVRGVRQVLNPRKDPWREIENDPLRDPDWRRRIGLLGRHGFSFDLQIYYQQMASAAALADEHPDVLFILNHAGMPARRDGEGLSGWRRGILELARRPNIAAKISGFGMVEPSWTVASIRPFVLHLIEAFGTERAMFASNFPVDKLMRGYAELWQAYDEVVADFTAQERERLFVGNATTHYRLASGQAGPEDLSRDP